MIAVVHQREMCVRKYEKEKYYTTQSVVNTTRRNDKKHGLLGNRSILYNCYYVLYFDLCIHIF